MRTGGVHRRESTGTEPACAVINNFNVARVTGAVYSGIVLVMYCCSSSINI